MNETGTTFKRIRARCVPLCAFESADPAHTISQCMRALNGKGDTAPLCEWDIIKGLTGLNEAGRSLVQAIIPQGMDPRLATGNPAECLTLLGGAEDKLLERAIVFWHQAHRQIGNEAVSQGFWNVRDKFKAIKATLVLLAPALILPPELKQDIMVVSEPLPDEAELAKIVSDILRDAELEEKVPEADRPVIVDILRGLSAFAAEQVMYLSLTPAGVDKAGLWERKKQMIEQTPGLSVWQGAESFDDLGGLENLKEFLRAVLTSGKTPVRAIGFIDEIEKGLAGSAGDTSGTSQDQLQVFLKVMQDLNVPGIILIGHAGTGKSAIAKAAGGVAGCPVISIDTGAMKGSLVGESEQRIRAAMDVFKAVSQGKGLFIATCNKIASLPPELRRRFTLGTFFVDLPTREEQAGIWDIWRKRYEMTGAKLPPCEGWTGAEIRACCDVAYRTGKTLLEAASFVVPVIKSAPDQVESLRNQATGRFLSASAPGIYSKPEKQAGAYGRKLEL